MIKVLSVASEIFPLAKTGGLADVVGSLPKALASVGVETVTLVPGYPEVMEKIDRARPLLQLSDVLGETATLLGVSLDGLNLIVLDIPALYNRQGGLYVDDNGLDHHDNWKRFAALSLVGADIASTDRLGWTPDVVHVHDWQAALTPIYMRRIYKNDAPVVLTIHNLAFQGQFSADLLGALELPRDIYSIDGIEYFDDISFLKGGIQFADAITTVSPTYAREILTPESGMGMNGLLRSRYSDLHGIVNGIDTDIWNPATDPYLPQRYDVNSIHHRATNKQALMRRFGLQQTDGCIFASVSRMTWQKGLDVLVDCIDDIVAQGDSVVAIGRGDRDIEEAMCRAAERHPGHVAVEIGYDEDVAHLIFGGADALVQPSRFEPCGLTQLYALRYGCVPLVSRTGGLAETIIDANDAALSAKVATGIHFHPADKENVTLALMHARQLFQKPKIWRQLQESGMNTDFSWRRSALQYDVLYRRLVHRHERDFGYGDGMQHAPTGT